VIVSIEEERGCHVVTLKKQQQQQQTQTNKNPTTIKQT
jgi:hypothetical protein